MLSVILRPQRKTHWASSSFGSIISQHRSSRNLAYTYFSREFKERDVPVAVAFHRASLLVYRDDHSFLPIFLVTFQNTKSFGDLPVHQAT